MATLSMSSERLARVSLGRLIWAGPLTVLSAIVVNTVIWQIAVAVLRPDPGFLPLSMANPVFLTLFGSLGAVVAYTFIGRFSRRPFQLFGRVASVALLFSFVPDVLVLTGGMMPGANAGTVGSLVLMHLAAYAICVNLLPRLSQAEA